jgi:hypothetical protein
MVHIDHPEITDWISQTNPNLAAKYAARNSVFANQQFGNLGADLQTPLFYENPSTNNAYTLGNTWGKLGFKANDQYLLGPKSVGAYLFINPANSEAIRVNGNDSISVNVITFGNNNSLNIPVTYQYRMTDYFGSGSLGLGNVGGDPNSNSLTNLQYIKTIGIDIYYNPLTKEKFSFDLEVSSRYYSKSIITKDIPARTFETALDDLNQTIKNITPSTSRDVGVGANLGGGNTNR